MVWERTLVTPLWLLGAAASAEGQASTRFLLAYQEGAYQVGHKVWSVTPFAASQVHGKS